MASKEQKEGVARVLDTLAASSIIGFTVSMAGYTVLTWTHEIILCLLTAVFLVFSWNLRRTS